MTPEKTLEEAAEKYAEPYRCPATNENEYCKHDIISAFNNGAKWHIKRFNESDENLNLSDVMNSKLNLYKNTLSLFIDKLPNDKIILDYFTIEDAHLELQDWVGMNLRKEIYWSTAIGVIEACDLILNEARSNGNLKSDYSISRNV